MHNQYRCQHVDQTLIQRLGPKRRKDIIGKSVLELQLYPNRLRGWCLTLKQPIHGHGKMVGLIGIARDRSVAAQAMSGSGQTIGSGSSRSCSASSRPQRLRRSWALCRPTRRSLPAPPPRR